VGKISRNTGEYDVKILNRCPKFCSASAEMGSSCTGNVFMAKIRMILRAQEIVGGLQVVICS